MSDLLPHEATAMRRAIEACIRVEKPNTADILIGFLERNGVGCGELKKRAREMPREPD